MTTPFSVRKPSRKIHNDEDDAQPDDGPVVHRPTIKPRKGSSFRRSFGPTVVAEDIDTPTSSGVVTPKRASALSRIAVQRHASKRSSLRASDVPARRNDDTDDDDGDNKVAPSRPPHPSGPTEALSAIPNTDDPDNATPSDLDNLPQTTQALDLSAKFGASLARYHTTPSSTPIPSAAEIAEKKARRARRARDQAAQEYISLDPDALDDAPAASDDDDDDDDRPPRAGALIPSQPSAAAARPPRRLTPDDEDLMEGFDDFTQPDTQLAVGARAQAAAARARRAAIAAQIAAAQPSDSDPDAAASPSSSSSSSSFASSSSSRTAAFEATQTHHGTYAARRAASPSAAAAAAARPRTPPVIAPLPTLPDALRRLHARAAALRAAGAETRKGLAALAEEKVRLEREEARVQQALRETAARFAAMKGEMGAVAGPEAATATATAAGRGNEEDGGVGAA